MSDTSAHIFDRSGMAALSDLDSPEWRAVYDELQADQDAFLARKSEFRSPEYKWPDDALRNWSRVWEYPYAMHHLRRWRATLDHTPKVVDFGCGVTFFPVTVARLGCDVLCTDLDPVCAVDVPKAAAVVGTGEGSVVFRQSDGQRAPFDDGEVDALYSLSVLEHIPDYVGTIDELARILRPGGLLVLTIDIDLIGNRQIGAEGQRKLVAALERHFDFDMPDRTVHPMDLLRTDNGPEKKDVAVARDIAWYAHNKLRSHKRGESLACQAFVMRRR